MEHNRRVACLFTVCLLAACPAEVSASEVDGRTVRGSAWTDLNIDGVRQPGEPGRPGVRITAGELSARTDRNGNYTLRDVPPDTAVRAPAVAPGGALLPAPPDQVAGTFYAGDPDSETDSDFLADGDTAVLPGSADVAHVDLGVARGSFDQKVELSTDRDTEALRVGDTVVATVTLRGWKGRPAQREADVSIPPELRFGSADGAGWLVETAPDGTLATIRPTEAQPIGTFHRVTLRLRVRAETATPGELAVRLNGRDADPANDVATQPVQVV